MKNKYNSGYRLKLIKKLIISTVYKIIYNYSITFMRNEFSICNKLDIYINL